MEVNAAQRLRCVDCGATDGERRISTHLGAASKPNDEGHVMVQRVPLCDRCANSRLAEQEETPLFG